MTTLLCSSPEYPERPIKVIVPFAAGGGSDTFVRILQQAIEAENLLPQPLVVINVPGAGGTIGSRQAKDAPADGYTVLCLHDAMITAKHSGRSDYGPEAFEPIAGTSEVGLVIAVADDAKYRTLKELLDDAANRPDQVVYSANLGAPSHFAGLLLERSCPRAKFRYTQTGGGARRFAALTGGHIQVSAFSIPEYLQFQPAGLRALAVCAEHRHPAAPGVPTAVEQGFDVISTNMQFWWAPQGTPPDRIAAFAEILRRAMQSQTVRDKLAAIHTDNVFLTGPALQRSLSEREARIAAVARRENMTLPNFPAITLTVVLGLIALVGAEELVARGRNEQPAGSEPPTATAPRRGLAVACLLATAIYVLTMQWGWLGFRMATAGYLLGLGFLLTRREAKRLPLLLGIALAMSLGLHRVFTKLLVIDLP